MLVAAISFRLQGGHQVTKPHGKPHEPARAGSTRAWGGGTRAGGVRRARWWWEVLDAWACVRDRVPGHADPDDDADCWLHWCLWVWGPPGTRGQLHCLLVVLVSQQSFSWGIFTCLNRVRGLCSEPFDCVVICSVPSVFRQLYTLCPEPVPLIVVYGALLQDRMQRKLVYTNNMTLT